eukprot:2250145-Rhodomonas_salina.1
MCPVEVFQLHTGSQSLCLGASGPVNSDSRRSFVLISELSEILRHGPERIRGPDGEDEEVQGVPEVEHVGRGGAQQGKGLLDRNSRVRLRRDKVHE